MKVNRGLRFPKVMFKIVCRLDYMPALPPRCCIAFSRQKHAIPRKGNNCKPSLVACVSPISSGASVKGELLPTLAARTCFTFEFVSPYLLCKPNLDDTSRLSHCCKPLHAACVWPYLLCKPNLDDTYEISARTIHKKVI